MPITISGKALGSRRPLFADFSVPLPPDDFGGGEGLTLRELITLIVGAEVRAYEQRREERRLDRVFHGREDRADYYSAGRVSPRRDEHRHPRRRKRKAVAAAILAFEDEAVRRGDPMGRKRDLDAQVFLRADSRVTFIRLVFLAGA